MLITSTFEMRDIQLHDTLAEEGLGASGSISGKASRSAR